MSDRPDRDQRRRERRPEPTAVPGAQTRRTFVRHLLSMPIAALVWQGCGGESNEQSSEHAIVESLLQRIPLPDPLSLGRRYLAEVETAPSFEELATEVFEPLLGAESPARLVDDFSAAMARDFETGAILPVAGWFLSKTEVRFCALLAHGGGD